MTNIFIFGTQAATWLGCFFAEIQSISESKMRFLSKLTEFNCFLLPFDKNLPLFIKIEQQKQGSLRKQLSVAETKIKYFMFFFPDILSSSQGFKNKQKHEF